MVRKILSLAAGVAVAATSLLMVVQSADARILRVHRYKIGRFIPATVRPGYVGAPGYPYGPPGPIVPILVDVPPAGSFFTPAGVFGFGTTVVGGAVTSVPGFIVPVQGGLVPGVPVLGAVK